MSITLNNTTIAGLANNGLPAGVLARTNMGYSGAPLQVVTVMSRSQVDYAAPISGNGTEIAIVTLSFTATAAGNKVVLEWMLNAEPNDHNFVYTITRNDVLLTDATNAANNRWAGLVTNFYDPDTDSTPTTDTIRFIDNSCLAGTNTYKIHTRVTNGTARTYRINRCWGTTNTNARETQVSVGILTEYRA